jgi:tripartite-type tricarboxylate transporter receptor subunit TctC
VRIVVPFAAGGGVDALARPLAKEMGDILGQTVFVENKPSANGQTGMMDIARAAPDGHALVISSAAYSITPAFYPKLPYDTFKDFAPVTVLAANPLMLVASTQFKANSVPDMIRMGKAGEPVNFAAPGISGVHFLAAELMAGVAGVKWTSVPYKGAGNAFPDLISGQADVMFDNPGSSLPLVQSGRLKLIATTGLKRSAVTPNVPTVSETLPGFDAANWFVLSAPVGTPPAVIDKLHQAAAKAMQAAAVRKMLESNGIEVIMNSPREAADFVQAEARKWGKIVVDNKLTVQP